MPKRAKAKQAVADFDSRMTSGLTLHLTSQQRSVGVQFQAASGDFPPRSLIVCDERTHPGVNIL